MNSHETPIAPWDNPILREGMYDASVVEIVVSDYGQFADPMLKIIFELVSCGCLFVTHIYFPHGNSRAANQRLWYFCNATGLEKNDILQQPDTFVGKRLKLQIANTHQLHQGQEFVYADVERFLHFDFGKEQKCLVKNSANCSDPFGAFPCDVLTFE